MANPIGAGAPKMQAPARRSVLTAGIATLGLALGMPTAAPHLFRTRREPNPVEGALRAQLQAQADPTLEAFYLARAWRPVWIQRRRVGAEARELVQIIAAADADGLDPERYGARGLLTALARAASGAATDLARLEAALSRAAADYLADLHRPAPGADMIYADPDLAPWRPTPEDVLRALAWTSPPDPALAELRRMNAHYAALHAALAAWRTRGGDPAVEQILRINLERARALPADLGRRHVLVDAAAQMLWLYQDGQAMDAMSVVVGKPSEPTPTMAGLIRYAVLRPYWNVPPDLARAIAPKVLRHGPGYLASQDMEALWGSRDRPSPAPTAAIDWRGVASGRRAIRLRQRPGPHNMMGQVKFVFPNSLGVYLHDSPLRQFFNESLRAESAGCVRVSAAPRLARWLLGERAVAMDEPGPPETRIDLDQPIPVYIVYFTAAPSDATGDVDLRPDIYRRDPTLAARLLHERLRA